MHPKTKDLLYGCYHGVVWLWLCSNWHRWPHVKPVYHQAHHTLHIFNGLKKRSVFSLYHCKAPDHRHMPFNSLFFYVLHPKAAHIYIYMTAKQSILSLISHCSISWCVMCYRWYIYFHSSLCTTGPLSACAHPHSTWLCAVNTPKKPLLWDSFPPCVHSRLYPKTVDRMISVANRLWILHTLSLMFFVSFYATCEKS